MKPCEKPHQEICDDLSINSVFYLGVLVGFKVCACYITKTRKRRNILFQITFTITITKGTNKPTKQLVPCIVVQLQQDLEASCEFYIPL